MVARFVMKSNKKRLLFVLAILTMAILLSCAFVACTKTETQDAQKKEFTITFDTQGGSVVKPITIAEGATITLPRNPTKEGYIFDGWYLSDEFIEKFNATQTISSNITVYAKWRLPFEDEVFVSFNTNGGDAIQGYYAIVGTKINLPVAPSRIGFDFDSWQYGDDKYPAGATFVVPNKNVEMVAIWNSQNLRYVTYDTNGGTEIEKSAVESGSKLTAPKQPKRPGYLFAGWYKDVNCTELWDFDKDKVVDNLTLYAKWNVDAVGISSVEGATIDGTNIFMVIDQDVEFVELAEKVILSGTAYWNLYYDRLGQTKIPTKIAANRETGKLNKKDNTFYILVSSADGLQEKLYTLTIYRRITINVNYYSVYNTLIHTYKMDNYNTILQEYDYEPVGYTLNGWEYVDTNNRRTNFKFDKNGTVVTTETALDLYPKVTANSYTVTLTVGNGETVSKNKVIATYDSSVQFPVPEKTGYSFVGWYNGSTKVSTETGICAKWTCLEDISLSPKWQINSYNVSLAKNVNGGDLTGGGSYQFGSNVTISATTNKAYIWIGWFEGDTKLTSEKSYSFKITAENRNFTAKWDIEDEYKPFIFDSTPNKISIVGVKDKNVKNIVVPDSVTSIGEGAFRGCSSLESITIPFVGAKAGVTSSDTYQYPFGYIFGTSSYDGGVKTSQHYFGSSTSSTTSTTYYIPSSLNSVTVTGGNILYGAFSGCTGLTSVTIPDSVTSIGAGAFSGCTGLTTVNWNATACTSAGTVNNPIFKGCYNLATVNIGDNVTTIPSYAFYNCAGLTSITIPDSVTSIGDYAFSGCSEITSIIVDKVNTKYHSAGNCLIETATKTLILGCKTSVIPTDGSVTNIGPYAFARCTGLTSIIIPNSVTNIGYDAFRYCTSLTSVTIGNDVTSIGRDAFSGCIGLTSVTIGNGVTSISSSAFSGCDKLQDIYITDIAAWCNISGLENLMRYGLSNKILYISNELATSITIPNGVTAIPSDAFRDCAGLTSVTIGNGVTYIGESAFQGCTGLTTVNWNATACTTAGSSNYPMFKNCSKLTIINIGDKVTTIPSYAFYDCAGLTSITIPNSVTSIGSSAFSGCDKLQDIYITDIAAWCNISGLNNLMRYGTSNKNLYINNELATSITIPNGVTAIPSSAFRGCTGLMSITIPDSVTSIGSSAFSGCSSLESITIPFVGAKAGVTSNDTYQYPFGYIFGTNSYTGGVATAQRYYGDSTSSDTYSTYYIPSSLKSVTITGGNILYAAFYNCTGLTSVTIGGNVTSIGDYTFYGCSGLTSVTIVNKVTSIGGSSFSGCTNLTSISIPDSVTSIGEGSFKGCNNLTSMTLPFIGASVTAHSGYDEVFGYIFGYTTRDYSSQSVSGATFQYYGNSKYYHYYIPSSIKSVTITGGIISNCAFCNCSGLTSVTIPGSVTSIGSSAFSGCTNLTSISIPDSVTSIGSYAFSGCTGLTSITIPNSVTNIGHNAFYGCSGLTSVTIGNGVTSIGIGAFLDCTRLTSITIPDSVTSIGSSAFSGTAWYNNQPDGLVYAGKVAYKYKGTMPNNTSIVLKEGTLSIGDSAFEGRSELTRVTIPNSVSSIGSCAFKGCAGLQRGLTSVTIGNSVTSIGDSAFYGCKKLTSITIPNSVASIGDWAFYGCEELTRITIPNSVTSIGSAAFSGTAWYNNQPDGLVYAGKVAYKYKGTMPNNTSIVLKEGTLSITEYAFSDRTELTSITISDSVMSIGKYAFKGCTGLVNITVAIGNTKYHSSGNCLIETESKTLIFGCKTSVIPSDGSVTSIGVSAFSGCIGLTSITIPDSVTSIGDSAFYGCTGLTSITIPDSVTSIGDYAFSGCTGLTSITIPDRVTSIGRSAFENCTGLTSINYSGTKAQWESITKGLNWKYKVPTSCKIICSDGTL